MCNLLIHELKTVARLRGVLLRCVLLAILRFTSLKYIHGSVCPPKARSIYAPWPKGINTCELRSEEIKSIGIKN
jgi:hypothetical protein